MVCGGCVALSLSAELSQRLYVVGNDQQKKTRNTAVFLQNISL